MSLTMLMPHELDAEEIGYYYDAIETDEHSGGPEVVSRLILDGLMELWVYNQDNVINVIITRIITHPDGYRELFIAMMAGSDVTSTHSHVVIHDQLLEYAKKQGASRLSACVKPEIWNHFKDITGYNDEYIMITLDANYREEK